jgi:hypothetical protein
MIYNIETKLCSIGLKLDKRKSWKDMYWLKNLMTLVLNKKQAWRSCDIFWLFHVGWYNVAEVMTLQNIAFASRLQRKNMIP